ISLRAPRRAAGPQTQRRCRRRGWSAFASLPRARAGQHSVEDRRSFKPLNNAESQSDTVVILMKQQSSLAHKDGDTVERLAALPSDRPSAVMALIERVALDPCADVEKLERVIAMYERLKAKEAELAYNAAKRRILKKLAGIKIVKNKFALYEV